MIPHQHGCSQIGDDKNRTFDVLAGTGQNPNVGAAIIISLGCEVIDFIALADAIKATGKPVEVFDIQSSAVRLKPFSMGLKLAKDYWPIWPSSRRFQSR